MRCHRQAPLPSPSSTTCTRCPLSPLLPTLAPNLSPRAGAVTPVSCITAAHAHTLLLPQELSRRVSCSADLDQVIQAHEDYLGTLLRKVRCVTVNG